jgi:hypothetical protein
VPVADIGDGSKHRFSASWPSLVALLRARHRIPCCCCGGGVCDQPVETTDGKDTGSSQRSLNVEGQPVWQGPVESTGAEEQKEQPEVSGERFRPCTKKLAEIVFYPE